MSLRKYGVNGKRRFSLKYPDGTIRSFGTCDTKDINDNKGIVSDVNQRDYWLIDYENEMCNEVLLIGTLATNGFYENEWDGWVSLEDFLNQE